MSRISLSVLIPTFNCAASIRDTLESVKWADEIVVVDSFSTDSTKEIAQEYGARIIQHDYVTPAKQKNWAIPFCSHEWILQLDSDEIIEFGLQEEIQSALSSRVHTMQAFRIPRKNHVLGKWVRYAGIYPDYQTRLFRKDACRFAEREVHERLDTSGKVGTLKHHLLHQGMPKISKQLANIDRYTRYEADEMQKQGKKFVVRNLLLRPWLVFLYRFVWLQGFRAGLRGFILCVYLACYEFFVQAKLWELQELHLESSPK